MQQQKNKLIEEYAATKQHSRMYFAAKIILGEHWANLFRAAKDELKEGMMFQIKPIMIDLSSATDVINNYYFSISKPFDDLSKTTLQRRNSFDSTDERYVSPITPTTPITPVSTKRSITDPSSAVPLLSLSSTAGIGLRKSTSAQFNEDSSRLTKVSGSRSNSATPTSNQERRISPVSSISSSGSNYISSPKTSPISAVLHCRSSSHRLSSSNSNNDVPTFTPNDSSPKRKVNKLTIKKRNYTTQVTLLNIQSFDDINDPKNNSNIIEDDLLSSQKFSPRQPPNSPNDDQRNNLEALKANEFSPIQLPPNSPNNGDQSNNPGAQVLSTPFPPSTNQNLSLLAKKRGLLMGKRGDRLSTISDFSKI